MVWIVEHCLFSPCVLLFLHVRPLPSVSKTAFILILWNAVTIIFLPSCSATARNSAHSLSQRLFKELDELQQSYKKLEQRVRSWVGTVSFSCRLHLSWVVWDLIFLLCHTASRSLCDSWLKRRQSLNRRPWSSTRCRDNSRKRNWTLQPYETRTEILWSRYIPKV